MSVGGGQESGKVTTVAALIDVIVVTADLVSDVLRLSTLMMSVQSLSDSELRGKSRFDNKICGGRTTAYTTLCQIVR